MDAFAHFITRFPRLNILAVCLITVLFGYQIIHIRMETALESFHIRGDKDISFAADFEDVFGSRDVIVIGVEGLQMTSLPALTRLERITERLEDLPFVEEVVSLANVLDVSPIQGGVKIEPLHRMLSERQGTAEHFSNLIKRNPFCLRNLVSEDGRDSSINVFLRENPGIQQHCRSHRFAYRGNEYAKTMVPFRFLRFFYGSLTTSLVSFVNLMRGIFFLFVGQRGQGRGGSCS